MNVRMILLLGAATFSTALSANMDMNDAPIAAQDILVTSSDFEEVSSLEQEILEWLQEFGISQGIEEVPEQLEYEKAVKVYVDTDIVTMDSCDREILLDALEEGNYVWVIPAASSYGNFQITVAKGLSLSEDAKPYLTEAQQQQIRDNEGKWEITEIAMDTVSPYIDELNAHASQLSECTRVVIAGSQTGFQVPVAVGFDDIAAKYLIGLGFQYPVADGTVRNTSVYEYDTLAERAKKYAMEQGGEVQLSGDEKQQWGGLLPAAKTQSVQEEKITRTVWVLHWWQFLLLVFVAVLAASIVSRAKRKSR